MNRDPVSRIVAAARKIGITRKEAKLWPYTVWMSLARIAGYSYFWYLLSAQVVNKLRRKA